MLVGAEPSLPYDRPPLSKQVLAGEWGPDEIVLRPADDYSSLALDMRLGRRATALDLDARAVVLAAREAMQNAAKFSGADEISVYAEAGEAGVSVFVRDRGAGFDRAAVPPDRHGLSESVEARMARAGGSAAIASSPGSGTEVELTLPRRPV